MTLYYRSVRCSWKHHRQTTRHTIPSRTTCTSSIHLIHTSSPLSSWQVKMGRDHTIFAAVPGYVRFYKEKWMRGERRFVGVVLNRGEVLPRDEATLGTSRYFGLVDRNGYKPQLLQGSWDMYFILNLMKLWYWPLSSHQPQQSTVSKNNELPGSNHNDDLWVNQRLYSQLRPWNPQVSWQIIILLIAW